MYKLIRAERLSAQKVSVGIFIQHFNLPHLNHCTVYKLIRAERLSAQKVSVGIFIQHFNLPHLNHCTVYKLIRDERLSAQKVSVGIFIQHFNLPHLNHCTMYKLVRAERYYLGYYKALQCTTFKPLFMLNSTQRPNLIDYPFTYMLKRHQFIKLFSKLSVLTPCSLYSWARNLNFLSICRCKVS